MSCTMNSGPSSRVVERFKAFFRGLGFLLLGLGVYAFCWGFGFRAYDWKTEQGMSRRV